MFLFYLFYLFYLLYDIFSEWKVTHVSWLAMKRDCSKRCIHQPEQVLMTYKHFHLHKASCQNHAVRIDMGML